MASRNQTPKWSADGKFVAFLSDKSGRDEIWIGDPEGKNPKKITDLDNEKGALVVDAGLEGAALHGRGQEAVQLHASPTARRRSSPRATSPASASVAVSPDSKWIAFSKQDRTLRSHVYIAPIAGGEERHVSDDALLYSEANAVWTADGRYLVFTSSEGLSNGIASQGGITTTMELWALSLRDQDRDPTQPRHRQRSAGAGRAKRRRGRWTRRRGRRSAVPVTCPDRLERHGAARAADSRCLARPSEGCCAVARRALGRAEPVDGRRGADAARGGAADRHRGHVHHQRRERPADARAARRRPTRGAGRGGGRGGGGGGGRRRRAMVFARDGRTLYFRSGTGLFAARLIGGGAVRRRRRRRPADAAAVAADAAVAAAAAAGAGEPTRTARQVTYTANIEVDHKALRAQVFNEGWRIMKNRFYDAEDARRGLDRERTQATRRCSTTSWTTRAANRHDDDDRPAQRVAHRRERRAVGRRPATGATRYPGFDLVADPSGFYKVGHIYKDGPADHDYLKIQDGDYIIARRRSRPEDDRQLLYEKALSRGNATSGAPICSGTM